MSVNRKVTVPVGNSAIRLLQRMLICTAAGEQGKSDVLVGGRLARRLNAGVTLLHVIPVGARDINPTAKLHLERAAATLRGLDIHSQTSIREAESPTEGILSEAKEGGHDLIVVGVHGPSSRAIFRVEDVTYKVLSNSQLPVLVVPIEEESLNSRQRLRARARGR